MFWIDLVFVFLIAVVFTAVVAGFLGWRHPYGTVDALWPAAIFLFLIFFFSIWAVGVWIEPFGPVVWGGAWLPFVFVAVVVALIIAAASPRRPRTVAEARVEAEEAAAAGTVFGVFFWLMLLVFLVAIIVAYAV